MMYLLSLLLSLSLFSFVSSTPTPVAPKWSPFFNVSGVVSLPYANVNEPFTQYYDSTINSQRIEWYNGMDIYIQVPSAAEGGVQYEVVPIVENTSTLQPVTVCFNIPIGNNNSNPTLSPFLPDLSKFSFLGTTTIANSVGQMVAVNQFTYSLDMGTGLTSVYTMSVEFTSGNPVQYEMMGWDSLIGSHFDHYIVTYSSYGPSHPSPTLFNKPNLPSGPCIAEGGSSGPTKRVYYYNPAAEMRNIFPPTNGQFSVSKEYTQFLTENARSPSDDIVKRQAIFHQNVMFINHHNRRWNQKAKNFHMKINKLADWKEEEFSMIKGYRRSSDRTIDAKAQTHKMTYTASTRPASVDWRTQGAVTAILDQSTCGSCWSFGSAASITGSYFLQTGVLTDFSSQYLMDCSQPFGNFGCDGGEDVNAYAFIMSSPVGLPTWNSYNNGQYLSQDGSCAANSIPQRDPSTGNITYIQLQSWVVINNSSEQLLDAIASRGPISVSIDANPHSFYFYAGGVYDDTACANGLDDLDHSVTAVGYGTDAGTGQLYYILKNQWSPYVGEQGYWRVAVDGNICGVADVPTYVNLA